MLNSISQVLRQAKSLHTVFSGPDMSMRNNYNNQDISPFVPKGCSRMKCASTKDSTHLQLQDLHMLYLLVLKNCLPKS